MAENLQRLVSGQKQLLADISHELRSPLARLVVALELARGKAATEAQPYLDKIGRQATDLNALIEELLEYSRLDALPQEPAREPVEVRELLDEVAAANAPQSGPKRIRVDTGAGNGLPPLRVERRLIARALGNALRNALAHSPEGSPVTVEARAEADGIVLAVRDSGPGVEPALLERIFEPFVRGDPARGRTASEGSARGGSPGTGLGLAIARRALQAHGGTAWAENLTSPTGERQGLVIRFWLPLK
jgi:signal transduction histidine kinase